jgi:uncharacterized membrane protein YdjX (TVP38/TMEM64 family)
MLLGIIFDYGGSVTGICNVFFYSRYFFRSELGKIALDTIFRERESLNISIVASINKAAESWGIACLRYEIRE